MAKDCIAAALPPWTPEWNARWRNCARADGSPRLRTVMLRRVLELGWRCGYQRAAGAALEMPLFYAWAGAVMQRDLADRVGNPGTGLQPRHMERIRRWTTTWKSRAGIG